MDKVERIKNEINKLIIPESKCSNISLMDNGRQYAYREVMEIIESLQDDTETDFGKKNLKELKTMLDDSLSKETEDSWNEFLDKCESEELEKAADEYCNNICNIVEFTEGDSEEEASDREYVERAFKAGANWQKKHLWKPTDGDDFPEIDREVIALVQDYHDDKDHLRVALAHRPRKYAKIWNSDLGEEQVVEIDRYDKGGWNIPFVKYWLDVKLEKEIEL